MPNDKPLNGRTVIGIIGGTELLGAERGQIEALRAMQTSGAKIVVGISDRELRGGSVGALCKNLGFEDFSLPFGSHFSKKWMLHDPKYRKRQIRRTIQCSKILLKQLTTYQPDVILIGSTLAFNFVALGLIINRTPLIFRVGDAPITQSKYQMFLWQSLAWRANHLVCISKYISKSIQPHITHNKKFNIIKNTPPQRLTAIDNNQVASLQKTKKPIQGVYVGQINHQKRRARLN